MDVHSSFLALSIADIEAHVDELVAEHIDGADRSRVMSYLNQTLAKDKATDASWGKRGASWTRFTRRRRSTT